MVHFRAAVSMLTRVPVRPGSVPAVSVSTTLPTGAAAFGAVGAVLGGAAALPLLVLPGAPLVAATLSVALLAGLSGALHLDGLADTADALAAPDPGRAEAARKDPRIGAAGAVAVVVVVILDVALTSAILEAGGPVTAAACLVAAAAASRVVAPVLAIAAGRQVRATGSAGWFVAGVTGRATVIAVASVAAVALAAAFVAGTPAPAIAATTGIAGGATAGLWLIARRDGLDGDLLGAATEIGFAAALLAALIVLVRAS